MTPIQKDFLHAYLKSLPPDDQTRFSPVHAEYFCNDEFNANECARLINDGVKTASCSLKIGYELEGEPLPELNRLTIVLDWNQNPVCIIRLTRLDFCKFKDVSARFAYQEGEGDRSYEWWYKTHLKFFSDYATELSVTFNEESELVLEYFEKVYPA